PAPEQPSRRRQRVEILRPEPQIPSAPRREEAPQTPVQPQEPAGPRREEAPQRAAEPQAPSSGVLIWSGPLRKGEVVTIDADRADKGTLRGTLPGVPVIIETDFTGIGFTEMPGPSNGWKRLSFRSLRDQNVVVTLRWRRF
ncbi:MAG: hypothetical protein ACP5U2_12605, partial [Bryobacteraceae bacterium]